MGRINMNIHLQTEVDTTTEVVITMEVGALQEVGALMKMVTLMEVIIMAEVGSTTTEVLIMTKVETLMAQANLTRHK